MEEIHELGKFCNTSRNFARNNPNLGKNGNALKGEHYLPAQEAALRIAEQNGISGSKVRKDGTGWKTSCPHPHHQDTEPSCVVSDGEGGRLLWTCFACSAASAELVKAAFEHYGIVSFPPEPRSANANGPRTDRRSKTKSKEKADAECKQLWPPPDKLPKFTKPKGSSKVYTYRDEAGRTVMYMARWEAVGDQRKRFHPYTVHEDDRGKRCWKAKAAPAGKRPLYRLNEIADCADQGILICEGEKDADGATEHYDGFGLVPTTPQNGAQSPHLSDWSPVQDRDVTIWPDNDQSGRDFADAVVDLCRQAGARTVAIVRYSEAFSEAPKWGLADPLPGGVDRSDLVNMIATVERMHGDPNGVSFERHDLHQDEELHSDQIELNGRAAIRQEAFGRSFPSVHTSGQRMGLPRANDIANIRYFLDQTGITFQFNLFANQPEVVWPVGAVSPFNDATCRTLTVRARDIGLAFNDTLFLDVCLDRADANAYHPVRDWLSSLEWDGVKRLNDWLTRYMGAEPTRLNNAVGRKLLIGACRRVMFPGCEHQWVPIFEGVQGVGKSQMMRALVGPHWYAGSVPIGADDKVTIERTSGKWLVEWQELADMGKREAGKFKQWISQQEDVARLAFGRSTSKVARQFIVVGTVNPEAGGYLQDVTGNRRYVPIKVGGLDDFDPGGLAVDREKLWAEAFHYARNSEGSALPREVWADAADLADQRIKADAWEDTIQTWLAGDGEDIPDCNVPVEGLWRALGFQDASRRSTQDKNRLDRIMTRLGFKTDRKNQPSSTAGGKHARKKVAVFSNVPKGGAGTWVDLSAIADVEDFERGESPWR